MVAPVPPVEIIFGNARAGLGEQAGGVGGIEVGPLAMA